jgi:hypothetical protein
MSSADDFVDQIADRVVSKIQGVKTPNGVKITVPGSKTISLKSEPVPVDAAEIVKKVLEKPVRHRLTPFGLIKV